MSLSHALLRFLNSTLDFFEGSFQIAFLNNNIIFPKMRCMENVFLE